VLTGRADVHYVVTEFGVAYLHGKTIRQRAEALVQIAHPQFRNELFEYCEKQRWFQKNQFEAFEMRGERAIASTR
jgi:acyl-CoA hydrolase